MSLGTLPAGNSGLHEPSFTMQVRGGVQQDEDDAFGGVHGVTDDVDAAAMDTDEFEPVKVEDVSAEEVSLSQLIF